MHRRLPLAAGLFLWMMGALAASSCVLDRSAGLDATGGGTSVGPGGAGGGGFGGSPTCDDKADCGTDTDCATVDCVQGSCESTFTGPGAPCMGDGASEVTCDGKGNCVECALPGDCEPGACSQGTQTGGEACSEGVCVDVPGEVECAPYVCDPMGETCLVNCAGPMDCVEEYYCNTTSSQCEPVGMGGDPCTVNEGCASMWCVDGVCCDDECAGECQSCLGASTGANDGVCAAVLPATDPDMECAAGFGCEGDSSCVECGEAPLPTGNNCPAICANGCAGGVCLIDCDQADECRMTTITCPTGYDCDVQCTGNDSCRDSTIDCPPTGACNVFCENNNHKCEDSTINCGAGPCTVDCDGGDTCDGPTVVNCGGNACDVTCSGSGKPAVNGGGQACSLMQSGCG